MSMKKLLPMLILLSFISACGSNPVQMVETGNPDTAPISPMTNNEPATTIPQENAPPPPAPTEDSPRLTIVLSNYTLVDAGDGWNEGTVDLALENKTQFTIINGNPSEFGDSSLFAERQKIIIETVEGPTYDGKLWWSDKNGFSGDSYIPAGFRYLNDGGGTMTLHWKSATAATPKRLTFPGHPEYDIDLPIQKGQVIAFPFDTSPVPMKSFSTLKGTLLANDPAGIVATFTGRCGNAYWYDLEYSRFDDPTRSYLEVNVVNNDKFNEKTVTFFPYSFSIFTADGHTSYGSFNAGEITLGPDQSKTIHIIIIPDHSYGPNGEAPVVVLYSDATHQVYDVYDVTDCGYKKP
jgi:hypothetical protein